MSFENTKLQDSTNEIDILDNIDYFEKTSNKNTYSLK
jgi:hypothetical protein